MTFGMETLERCGYAVVKKKLKIIVFAHFDGIHERDRQTDGRTPDMTAWAALMHRATKTISQL